MTFKKIPLGVSHCCKLRRKEKRGASRRKGTLSRAAADPATGAAGRGCVQPAPWEATLPSVGAGLLKTGPLYFCGIVFLKLTWGLQRQLFVPGNHRMEFFFPFLKKIESLASVLLRKHICNHAFFMWSLIHKQEPTFLADGETIFFCLLLLSVGSMNGGFENLPFQGQISKCCSHRRLGRLEVRPGATARVAAHCGSALAVPSGRRTRAGMAQFSSLG